MLMFSVAWALEMVTHLEELCFWLFLVNSGAQEQDWFTSYYFRTWVFGSLIAVTYMPLVTIFTRSDPLQSEAYSFLAGSLGSLCLTLWFTPILWTFPRFLANLRAEGVDMSTIVRLTKFQELNRIRIIFRFIFVVPLLILGIDGVRPHNHINESMFWTDLLAVLAGFGCAISSGITLTIFFPRSIEGEIAERDARERKRKNSSRNSGYINPNPPAAKNRYQNPAIYSRAESENGGTYLLTSSPIKKDMSLPPDVEAHSGVAMTIERSQASYSPGGTKHWDYDGTTDEGLPTPTHVQQVPIRPLRPNRRRGDDVELGGVDGLTETNLTKLDYQYGFGGQRAGAGAASVMGESRPINNFTSPIDFVYRAAGDNMSQGNGSRLTFTRH
ncbi:hypothetical protein AX16_000892 [Volvariella volvacea WC 439]|nr:hypothetical protein AX16_000892 [Volvariella volvacea WC 439]